MILEKNGAIDVYTLASSGHAVELFYSILELYKIYDSPSELGPSFGINSCDLKK